MIWMAVGPPLVALAWFLLPIVFVPLIGTFLVIALLMFSSRWAELSNEVTSMGREKLRREIAEFKEHDQ
jgi:hypothetical protein